MLDLTPIPKVDYAEGFLTPCQIFHEKINTMVDW